MFGFKQFEPERDQQVLQMPVSFSDYLSASAKQGWNDSMFASIYRWEELRLEHADQNSPMISAEDANKRYGLPTLKFDKPIREGAARLMHKRKTAELERMYFLENGYTGFFSARNGAGMLTGMVASVLNPLDFATMFLPVVGSAARAETVVARGFQGPLRQKVIRSATPRLTAALERGLITEEGLIAAAVPMPRLVGSVINGTLSGAVMTLPHAIAAKQDKENFTVNEYFLGLGMMAGLSASIHAGVRGFQVSRKALRGAANRLRDASIETKRAAVKQAVEQSLRDEPVRVDGLIKIDENDIRARVKAQIEAEERAQRAQVEQEVTGKKDEWFHATGAVDGMMSSNLQQLTGKDGFGRVREGHGGMWLTNNKQVHEDMRLFVNEEGYLGTSETEMVDISKKEFLEVDLTLNEPRAEWDYNNSDSPESKKAMEQYDAMSDKIAKAIDDAFAQGYDGVKFKNMPQENVFNSGKTIHDQIFMFSLRNPDVDRNFKQRLEQRYKAEVDAQMEKWRKDNDPEQRFSQEVRAEIDRQVKDGKALSPEDVVKYNYDPRVEDARVTEVQQEVDELKKELGLDQEKKPEGEVKKDETPGKEEGQGKTVLEDPPGLLDRAITRAEEYLKELNKPNSKMFTGITGLEPIIAMVGKEVTKGLLVALIQGLRLTKNVSKAIDHALEWFDKQAATPAVAKRMDNGAKLAQEEIKENLRKAKQEGNKEEIERWSKLLNPDMNRRGFLSALGKIAAVAGISPSKLLPEPTPKRPVFYTSMDNRGVGLSSWSDHGMFSNPEAAVKDTADELRAWLGESFGMDMYVEGGWKVSDLAIRNTRNFMSRIGVDVTEAEAKAIFLRLEQSSAGEWKEAPMDAAYNGAPELLTQIMAYGDPDGMKDTTKHKVRTLMPKRDVKVLSYKDYVKWNSDLTAALREFNKNLPPDLPHAELAARYERFYEEWNSKIDWDFRETEKEGILEWNYDKHVRKAKDRPKDFNLYDQFAESKIKEFFDEGEPISIENEYWKGFQSPEEIAKKITSVIADDPQLKNVTRQLKQLDPKTSLREMLENLFKKVDEGIERPDLVYLLDAELDKPVPFNRNPERFTAQVIQTELKKFPAQERMFLERAGLEDFLKQYGDKPVNVEEFKQFVAKALPHITIKPMLSVAGDPRGTRWAMVQHDLETRGYHFNGDMSYVRPENIERLLTTVKAQHGYDVPNPLDTNTLNDIRRAVHAKFTWDRTTWPGEIQHFWDALEPNGSLAQEAAIGDHLKAQELRGIDPTEQLIGDYTSQNAAVPIDFRKMDRPRTVFLAVPQDARVDSSHYSDVFKTRVITNEATKDDIGKMGLVTAKIDRSKIDRQKRIKITEDNWQEMSVFTKVDAPVMQGWARVHTVVLPDGRKALHVYEVQSDIRQRFKVTESVQERGPKDVDDYKGLLYSEAAKRWYWTQYLTPEGEYKTKGYASKAEADKALAGHLADYMRKQQPLIDSVDEVLLKSLVKLAKKEGLDGVIISDLRTVLMTEGHLGTMKPKNRVKAELERFDSFGGLLIDRPDGRMWTQQEVIRGMQEGGEITKPDEPAPGQWGVDTADGRFFAIAHNRENAISHLKYDGFIVDEAGNVKSTNPKSSNPYIKLRQLTEDDFEGKVDPTAPDEGGQVTYYHSYDEVEAGWKSKNVYQTADTVGGMKHAYGNKLPNIMRKITGAAGEPVEIGGEEFFNRRLSNDRWFSNLMKGFDQEFPGSVSPSGTFFPVKQVANNPYSVATPQQIKYVPKTDEIDSALNQLLGGM